MENIGKIQGKYIEKIPKEKIQRKIEWKNLKEYSLNRCDRKKTEAKKNVGAG